MAPLIPWWDAARPLNLARHFGRAAPLEVEIGCGNGEFLVRSAVARPRRNFIGIELDWASVRRALRRIALAGAANVRVLQGDATVAFSRLLGPRSVSRVQCLFPCPWAKRRHARHRLFSYGFLRLLNSRLVAGGVALVASDDPAYIRWIIEQVPGCGFAAGPETTAPRFDTKYERKWRRGGVERFFVLRLRKREHVETPLEEDVSVKTYRLTDFHPRRFRPADIRGEIPVEFRDFVYDPEREKGMVRAVVVEEGLVQDFWVEISRDEGGWRICPAPGCRVLPTRGVQLVLAAVHDAACPGAEPGPADEGGPVR